MISVLLCDLPNELDITEMFVQFDCVRSLAFREDLGSHQIDANVSEISGFDYDANENANIFAECVD